MCAWLRGYGNSRWVPERAAHAWQASATAAKELARTRARAVHRQRALDNRAQRPAAGTAHGVGTSRTGATSAAGVWGWPTCVCGVLPTLEQAVGLAAVRVPHHLSTVPYICDTWTTAVDLTEQLVAPRRAAVQAAWGAAPSTSPSITCHTYHRAGQVFLRTTMYRCWVCEAGVAVVAAGHFRAGAPRIVM